MPSSLVARPAYDALLDAWRTTPEVKVLTGVRRCGKSSLLELFANRLVTEGLPIQNVIHLRLDGYDVPLEPDASWLMDMLSQRLDATNPSQATYVLLDEVQEVSGWEDVVRRLRNRPNTQVTITGSNARVLSGELATLLAGRYVELPVYPLSFAEYRSFAQAFGWETAGSEAPANVLFQDYLAYGGMPALFAYPHGDERSYERVLSGIFDTVILKDVVARERIKDIELLERLVRYVFSTSGNLFSTKRVVDALTSAGRRASQETVDNYLRSLVSAKILMECEQWGLGGKEVLRPQRKYYPVDTGLRNLMAGFSRTRDLGFQLECVVHNELMRRGWRVGVGALRTGEVDFVAQQNDERLYLQVSLSVLDETTFQREVAPFEAISDAFPKVLLVADNWRLGTTENGVRVVNIADWLLGAEG